jgi:NitT/TauT family transport system substrate-binding protein
MEPIHVQFSRFSAFYSPIIATIAKGFLQDEGLEPSHSVSPPGVSAIEALVSGAADVVQSAPSQAFRAVQAGDEPPAVHFAQVNEKDGFFLLGRSADPDFIWSKLEGAPALIDHGGQPTHMFKYACLKSGIDYGAIDAIDAGAPDAMIAAFRAGQGDYIHLQGPAPQQLEHDGVGHIVARVGDPIGPCAFSSLAATREWLTTDKAAAFTRAYRRGRQWLLDTPAAEVAALERDYFPEIDEAALSATIAAYQSLGNWTPHIEITRDAFAVSVEIFRHAGVVTGEVDYDKAIAAPPEG